MRIPIQACRLKRVFLSVFVITWATFMVYILSNSPSSVMTAEKLKEAQADVDAAVRGNGRVIHTDTISKFGSMWPRVDLDAESLSKEQRVKIIGALSDLRWRRIDKAGHFCKDGILLEFHYYKGTCIDSHCDTSIATINSQFGSNTERVCRTSETYHSVPSTTSLPNSRQ